jgi:hypothetical protein
MANETVFREKSIEQISSPDRLNDYIKLSDPGTCVIIAAILVILTGACVFGIFGHMDSCVPGVGIARKGKMVCMVKKEYGDMFTGEMEVRIDGTEYPVSIKSERPVTIDATMDQYALNIGNMQAGEWVYEFDVEGSFDDGAYDLELITEKISPLSFLLNNNEQQ